MCIFKPGICPLPTPTSALRLSPARAAIPASQLRHTFLRKPWQRFLEQRDTFQESKLGFLLVLFGFFFISELAGKAERESVSSATRQLTGITCLKKEGGVGGDFGGTASRAIGVLRFAEQVADLSLLHSSHPDVPRLDYLT